MNFLDKMAESKKSKSPQKRIRMSDHSTAEHKTLAWVDIETTGLDESNDAILEIGIVVTPGLRYSDDNPVRPDLGVLDQKSWVVRPTRKVNIQDIDPYVWKMHTESGLWEESLGSDQSIHDVIAEMKTFMFTWDAIGSPLCGNSVHFDRRFLSWQARDLLKLFHYRNLDVSSIKNMLLQHFPYVLKWVPEKKAKHRVLADLVNTLDEYDYYLAQLIR